MSRSGYATGVITKAPAWRGLVAWDMLFNGMTTGLFLVAAISELVAPDVFGALATVAYRVALVLLLVDLACLVLDLGDPLRFHHMLRVWKPGSPMSFGTWCLTVYALPLTVAAGISVSPGEGATLEGLRRLVVIVGLVPALGAAVYKGILLSTNAQPGWKDARWLGGYLTSSALVLGAAEMLALAVLMGNQRAATIVRLALGLLLVINAVPLLLLLVDVRATLARLYPLRELYGLGALSVGGGLLLPLWLLAVEGSPRLMPAAALCIVLASLVIRFVIVRLPHDSR